MSSYQVKPTRTPDPAIETPGTTRPPRKPTVLRAEGGMAVTVKLRKTDYARLEHMKTFCRKYLGLSPSTAILLRWMIEDQQRYVDELIELCGLMELKYVPEARAEKVNLARVIQDDDRIPPDLPCDEGGAMPTFAARINALNMKTPSEERY